MIPDAADEPLVIGHEPAWGADLARHYLKDLVYGANDGIITTFAVVSGVAGASLSPRTVIILGLANLFADGFSMGASNFLAIRSDEAVRAAGTEVSEPYPARHGLATALAFILMGSIPLAPYLFSNDPRFGISVFMTLATLFLVGAARSLVSRMHWWKAGVEMLLVGAVAAGVSYAVGYALSGVTNAPVG